MTRSFSVAGYGDHVDIWAEFVAAAGELLARTLARPDVRGAVDDAGFSPQAWAAVAEAGWFEVALCQEHGGLGLGIGALGGIAFAVGRHLLPGPIADHAAALPLLVPRVSSAARERLLAAVRGWRLAVLVDGAATWAPVSARPRISRGRITGVVELVRFAQHADDLIVVADGPDESSPTVVLLDSAADGITITPQGSFDPITRYATIELDGARAEEVLISPGPAAPGVIEELRSAIRLFAAAETAGSVRNLLDTSVTYAQTRIQFGRPIGAFQALQHVLADMAVAVLLLEAATIDVFTRAADQAALQPLSYQIKALAAAVGRQVGEAALQVHGGIAFTVENELHRAVEHALALQGLYGDNRQLARNLGQALLCGDLDASS